VTPARGAEDQASWTVRLEDPDACSGCGTCVDVCPRGAIGLNDVAVIDDELCDGCARCVDACPQGALTMEAA
jgi:ferredoxin